MQEGTSNYNFCGLDKSDFSKEEAHFFILPIPYEATTTYRPGTRFGPQAIIDASVNMELYDEELRQETYKAGIHTLPSIDEIAPVPPRGWPRGDSPGVELENFEIPYNKINGSLQDIINEIEKDKVLISLGGEHSISVGLIRAFRKKYPKLSVLYLDAHADLRDTYQQSSYSHACSARRIQETTPIVLAGTRSLSAQEAKFVEETGQKVFWGKDALTNPDKVNSLLTDTVYISLDVDIMDPSIMPATGTPEPDGWLWQELANFLKNIILTKKIVGVDIVEFSPIKDNPAPDFSIAKLIYRMMGYITQASNWLKP